LLTRIRSADEEISAEAHQEWEQAIIRSRRRWQKIQAAFPKKVQRFEEDQVCLHDAQVLSMGQHGRTFIIVLQTEPPTQQMVLLMFTLDQEPQIDTTALPGKPDSSYVTWMYEEFDLGRHKQCTFEVLLSNGWAVKLRFQDFHFLMGQQILPPKNDRAARVSPPPIPRSA